MKDFEKMKKICPMEENQPSWLKASAFFSLKKKLVIKRHNNLYLGLVAPSNG